jgi:hypothetical protein
MQFDEHRPWLEGGQFRYFFALIVAGQGQIVKGSQLRTDN